MWILFFLEGVETWPKLGWHGWERKKGFKNKKLKKKKEFECTRMTYLKKLKWKKE